ncbi:hypothetical protein BQ8794_60169 [Mesorhizobium prunaredense]|uniref:Uncharacterized protein n=1 Tax=Mesorhizobium prunaredense TaxID=1631249 RepID=A0A1R3VG06_9HYPH|nr:hypothetical protein BQ8794_60169 [Mesorhizobium prunaredense]
MFHFSPARPLRAAGKNPEVFRSGTAFVLSGGGLAYVCVRGRLAGRNTRPDVPHGGETCFAKSAWPLRPH